MAVTYEVIQSAYSPPNLTDPAKSVRGAAWAGGTKAVSWFALGSQYLTVKSKVDTTTARMEPEIKKAQGSRRGVLLIALIQEWDTPHDLGRAKKFHSLLIGPAGNDRDEALRCWNTHDLMYAAPPPGWRLTPIYLWAKAS